MKIIWKIEQEDLINIRKFLEDNKDNIFVKKRISRNINKDYGEITKSDFFKTMISCLLTTQQRSGPQSSVTKFINTKPFPLQYELCLKQADLKNYILKTLDSYSGIRKKNKITDEITTNLEVLEKKLWHKIFEMTVRLKSKDSIAEERMAADLIMDNFKGFGPKQSRNLLQSLGLTKYEIPIDSRITKWLEKYGFPIKLSAMALGDINYYNFISDGFQILCKEIGIEPCIMDAIIFSSYDLDWTEQNVVW